MILKSFEYFEFINDKKFWAIKSFELEKINLFTAKNATGKSRTIKAIHLLSTSIMDNYFNDHANYAVEFSDGSEKYHYVFSNDGKKVVSEKLIKDNTTLLYRDGTGKGEIFTAQLNRNIDFQAQENKLAISRRDKLQYPYLEKIHLWANSLHYYSFGTSMKQEYGKAIDDKHTILYDNSDNSVEIFAIGELEFDKEFKESVLSSMNSIGYNLSVIDIQRWLNSNINVRSEDYTLFVSERDNDAIINQYAMSQGMFRALSIIIHLTYHAMMKIPTTILIDDIGEGLDFERSTKLIKLLIELAEKNDNIQLIMSTNDRFVMNNVPLEYWQVIQRKGGECRIYNYQNSKEIFDEFAYTGLNNFDFLATDFLNPEK
jgi:energy-coupling factor transporter ATP-binding protein EcfA2